MSYNSWSNRARNFKSASRLALVRFWNYSLDYSLNCTPLGPITITNKRWSWYAEEQGWCSGESAGLPPMCPGFDSRTRRHMWIEFVLGSLPGSERFFPGYSGFLLSSKTNISKFQFDLHYCQALYYEALVRVIAQALPVFDVKFTLFLHFSRKLVRGFFLSASKTTIMVLLKSGVTGKFLRNYWQVTIF